MLALLGCMSGALQLDRVEMGLRQVVPHRMERLELPLYGAEHLLLLRSMDAAEAAADPRLLPALLPFQDGQRLEQLAQGEKASASALELSALLLARREFFEAAAGRSRPDLSAPWALLALNSHPSLAAAMLHFLSRCELTPSEVVLSAEGAGEVRSRDLGAFTGAQPSSVKLGELSATLLCTARGDKPITPNLRQLRLEGAAEAIEVSRLCGAPLLVDQQLWRSAAVDDSGTELPLVRPSCTIRFGERLK